MLEHENNNIDELIAKGVTEAPYDPEYDGYIEDEEFDTERLPDELWAEGNDTEVIDQEVADIIRTELEIENSRLASM